VRQRYPYLQAIPTRWMDNDVYGHVNNVVYYSYFDTVINSYLIAHGGLDIHAKDGQIGLCVESHCRYAAPLSFPGVVEAGLRVETLGRSSVRYAIGLFAEAPAPAAEGWFVHVFVDRQTRRPEPIAETMRAALRALLVETDR
jgi:acyl-CoA thioester hydrolase